MLGNGQIISLKGGLTLAGLVVGALLWIGFDSFVNVTNQMTFCTGMCHEMREFVYAEFKQSSHYNNRSGVSPQCSDCHVPKPFLAKMWRKLKASKELFVHLVDQPDTIEKFDAIRPRLAASERRRLFDNGSAECKNCHNFDNMRPELQKDKAKNNHQMAKERDIPCITCHQNLVHKGVEKTDFTEELEAAGKLGGPTKAAPAQPAVAAAPPPPAAPAAAGPIQGKEIDWASVPETLVTLLYPGQASIEWVLNGMDHGGGMAFKNNGEKCMDCHNKELAKFGDLLVKGTNSKGAVIEPTPIPDKLGHLDVQVKAAYDDENLYLHFNWKTQPTHAPVPFADGGKLDPDNEIKLSVLVDDGRVEFANQGACWVTCHHDMRYMPHAPEDPAAVDGNAYLAKEAPYAKGFVTKYLPESRTAWEIKGKFGKKRGGWDKLKDEKEIEALLASGVYLDGWQWRGGRDNLPGKGLDGNILAARKMDDQPSLVAKGEFADGAYTVTMVRRLNPGGAGNKALVPGNLYTVGFAIHDDYASARFHHVSMNYTLGFDDPNANINAVKK